MNFDPFFQIFGGALAFFYSLVPNYGFIIVALTLVVMILVTPLTLKATRSMMMMQQLQPEMKKLQSRYKDDRQKLNEELMKFYKENNINPVGGCLPLLIQMPVFFLLYAVLRGLTLRVPVLGTNTGWVLGEQSANVNLTNPPDILHFHNFQPEYVPKDSNLYNSLSATNVMNFFGMDLASSCTEIFSRDGALAAIPYVVLIIIVGATSFIQQRQIQGRNPNAQVNPQQQQIMKIMPFFLPLISFGLPSGLVLYFAVSNLYRVGQQWFIGRTIYGVGQGGSGEKAPAELAGGGKKGGPGAKAPREVGSGKDGAGQKGRKSTSGDDEFDDSGSKPAARKGTPAKARGGNGTRTTSSNTRTSSKQTSSDAKASTRPSGKTTPAKGGGDKRGGTKAAAGSSSGRGSSRTGGRPPATKASERASDDRSNGGERRGGGAPESSPALQPRARKNKKR